RRVARVADRPGDSQRSGPAPGHPQRCPGSPLLWSGDSAPPVGAVAAAGGAIADAHPALDRARPVPLPHLPAILCVAGGVQLVPDVRWPHAAHFRGVDLQVACRCGSTMTRVLAGSLGGTETRVAIVSTD